MSRSRAPATLVGSLVASLLAAACSSPTAQAWAPDPDQGNDTVGVRPEPRQGPFDVHRVTVQAGHYRGDDVVLAFDAPLLLWPDPFDADSLDGIHVEVSIGSLAESLAYVPIRDWLWWRNGPAQEAGRVDWFGVHGDRADSVRIHDPRRELLGRVVAGAVASDDTRSDALFVSAFVIEETSYEELYRPVFTVAVRLPDRGLYWYGFEPVADGAWVGGTFVGAWVAEAQASGDTVYTPVSTWIRTPGRYRPSDLYVVELGRFEVRFRDEARALRGQTLVVAHTRGR